MSMQTLGGSFQIANQAPKRRLVVAVDGLDKGGKTNFLLTAPGPIAYQNFDDGEEGVIEKFQTQKTIWRADYPIIVKKDQDPAAIMKAVEPIYDRFVTDYQLGLNAIQQGALRTIGVDTASEWWEVLRLARFGKLTQVMPHHYTALNTEYRNLIRGIYQTSGNLVLLHKLKAEWKDNPATGKGSKTGGYERAGFSDTGFLVQVNVLAWRDQVADEKGKRHFHITVQNCRQNPNIAGLDLVDEMATFPWLGVHVFPDSSLEDWQ